MVFGRAGGFAPSLDLSALDGMNGFRLDGTSEFDASGFSVASAGDVNGDGFDDVIIGAHGADPNGFLSGASYVVFGQSGGFAPSLDLAALDGTTGFRLDGGAEFDHSGKSVASAGDVNGDGFDDVIIGARDADMNGYESGSSYVVFGQAGGFAPSLDLSALDGTNGFHVRLARRNNRRTEQLRHQSARRRRHGDMKAPAFRRPGWRGAFAPAHGA